MLRAVVWHVPPAQDRDPGSTQPWKGGTLRYHPPKVTDHGSIIEHTFYRCETGTGLKKKSPPKDWRDFPLDKHGECSSGHAS